MKALLTTLLLLGAGAATAAPSVQACVAASAEGQEALKRGALLAAQRSFGACADAACPQLVRADCTRWLEEVLQATPSLNVAVRVRGVDQPWAEVDLDGRPWLDHLDGRPKDVDPGDRLLTVRLGGVRASRKLVVVQGEKNRVVAFELEPVEPPTQTVVVPVPTPAPVEPVTPPAVTAPSPVAAAHAGPGFPVGPVVLSGLALAGAGTFAGLGLAGKGRLDALLAQPCAATKTCDPAEVAAIRRELVGADVALGVGLASALAAAGWWWWWGAQQPPAVVVAPGAGSVQVLVRLP